IDYGKKRTGLAVADDQTRIPLPLCVIESSNDEERIRRISEAIEDQGAEAQGLRTERDQIRARVAEMLDQLEGLSL
ncbi:MAG: Holliday junction resolvase RuvX, partial [Vicinamibacterales bacterium]|nr:Holliday junction resolvase RuvX [Vicinamibacterales bacterium]